jgi:hypothetical protein
LRPARRQGPWGRARPDGRPGRDRPHHRRRRRHPSGEPFRALGRVRKAVELAWQVCEAAHAREDLGRLSEDRQRISTRRERLGELRARRPQQSPGERAGDLGRKGAGERTGPADSAIEVGKEAAGRDLELGPHGSELGRRRATCDKALDRGLQPAVGVGAARLAERNLNRQEPVGRADEVLHGGSRISGLGGRVPLAFSAARETRYYSEENSRETYAAAKS